MLIVDLITLYTTASVLFIFLVYSHSIGVNNTKHYNMKVTNCSYLNFQSTCSIWGYWA